MRELITFELVLLGCHARQPAAFLGVLCVISQTTWRLYCKAAAVAVTAASSRRKCKHPDGVMEDLMCGKRRRGVQEVRVEREAVDCSKQRHFTHLLKGVCMAEGKCRMSNAARVPYAGPHAWKTNETLQARRKDRRA